MINSVLAILPVENGETEEFVPPRFLIGSARFLSAQTNIRGNGMRLQVASLALLVLGAVAAEAKPYDAERIVWARPMQPFHVIGNIHYVGTAGISAFLIVTPEGNILTDGGLEETADAIA